MGIISYDERKADAALKIFRYLGTRALMGTLAWVFTYFPLTTYVLQFAILERTLTFIDCRKKKLPQVHKFVVHNVGIYLSYSVLYAM